MTITDKLTDELLEAYASGKWKSYERDNIAMARELLAHRRASQAASTPSDGLREPIEAERERIAVALETEADLLPCAEDAAVTRSNAALIRADFSYEDADRAALSASPAQEGGESDEIGWSDISSAPKDGSVITLMQDGVEYQDHEWFEGSWSMVFCDQAGPYVAQRLTHPTQWKPQTGGGQND